MFNTNKFTTEFAGRTLTIETGLLANQAAGSCTVQYGETVVLATACYSQQPKEGTDFFPLTVDYEEKLYSAGKIKGSRWIKREGRPNDEAILTSRLIDRSLRPLFQDSERREVQVTATVLSFDQQNSPDITALIATSCALAISPIPWNGPVSGVKIGRINGEWVINPSYEAITKSDLDLVVVGTTEDIVMIEAGSKEVVEKDMIAALEFAQKHLREGLKLITEVVARVGQQKNETSVKPTEEEIASQQKIDNKVKDYLKGKDLTTVFNRDKKITYSNIDNLKTELTSILKADNEVNKEERLRGVTLLSSNIDNAARDFTLTSGKRIDGRSYDEIRELDIRVSALPRTHGSGLFTRGETQVLSVVTLGAPGDEQYLENIEDDGITKKRYMHHYNFPGYSVGEVKRSGTPGRREIGHGALAEKALVPVIPNKETFPYTIRVVSEVLSSNGSSSQASICGSTLALMDAGVPISKPVAGIAMGLVTNPKDKNDYKILTDIQGFEDHAGDMDFKIAGTNDGITAVQLDIKLGGVSLKVLEEALWLAKAAREKILQQIIAVIPAPRAELSPYAPRIEVLNIDPEQIRDVIGPGGKIINDIIEKTGVEIDIEQDGTVLITSTSADGSARAIQMIMDITKKIQVGEEYEGQVVKIIQDKNNGNDIGAIVQLTSNHDGMVHISNLANKHVARISDIVNVGDLLKVRVVEVDEERGRIGLSHKEYTPAAEPGEERGRFDRPNHGPHNTGNDRRPFHKRF